ncbi:MAG: ABC transporter permease [Nitrospiraceae bacterium]
MAVLAHERHRGPGSGQCVGDGGARERTREYGVMKTLGFQPRHLVALVLGESLLVALGGAWPG